VNDLNAAAIWDEAVTLFYEHPILGVGTGAVAGWTNTIGSHNTFLSVLVEMDDRIWVVHSHADSSCYQILLDDMGMAFG
jgi:hypothetical protein